jgi:hypothetical protein
MSDDDSTRPAAFPKVDAQAGALWQRDDAVWSLGPVGRRLVGDISRLQPEVSLPDAKNTNGTSTVGPQKITPPKMPPSMMRSLSGFGKRAFQPISQWEGVVESVNGTSFNGRVVQLDDGRASHPEVDFNEFSFEDLADKGDWDLVRPGAVFYWSVGRLKNRAGTIYNTSLVRFRRIPAHTAYIRKQAELEARAFLESLGSVDPA